MLFFSFILALVIGTYVGSLIVRDFFKLNPFETIEETTDLDIIKEFEEVEDKFNK